jgi:hypothetical protein
MSGQHHAPSVLGTRKSVPGNNWIGGCVVPAAGLKVRASSKRLSLSGIDSNPFGTFIFTLIKKSIERVFLRPKQPEHEADYYNACSTESY